MSLARAMAARLPCGIVGRCVAAVVLAAVTPACAEQGRLQAWTGAPEAPPIELRTVEGRPFSLSDLRGRVVLVNFWASWCEPCIDEMPSIQRLRERLAGEGFEIVAVNFQEGEPRIRAFLARVPVTFPIVRDTDGGVAKAWQVRIFPSSFVVDPEGQVRYLLVGSIDWSAADVERTLRTLLRSPLRAQPRR